MIGGIIAATLLTLLFLPALYVGWYRISRPSSETASPETYDLSARQAAE